MRFTLVAALALTIGTTVAAPAQTLDPAPCVRREANLGGIGRALVVGFTGAIFGERVCATVANIAIDGFTARIIDAQAAAPEAPSGDALVSAALGDAGSVTLPLDGATVTNVGPYAVEPGGKFPQLSGDTAAQPRVVFAYAGQRVLVIAMTAVAMPDLVRVLRDQPDLFHADAIERAVVLSSRPDAAIALRTDAGMLGELRPGTHRILQLIKRP